MKNYILVTGKQWHDDAFEHLTKNRKQENWIRITDKREFNPDNLKRLNPEIVFIPHWSYIISAEIFENFECIVFHMTDLPYGRGGSPLQNLIIRGHEETKVTAIRVEEGIDTGDIYLKKPLKLHGTAEEIFLRSSMIILLMIEEIIDSNIKPVEQRGEITNFKRRKPKDGNIEGLEDPEKMYDYIRMLDAPGYPKAFIEVGNVKLEFSRASLKSDKSIIADVRITKK